MYEEEFMVLLFLLYEKYCMKIIIAIEQECVQGKIHSDYLSD